MGKVLTTYCKKIKEEFSLYNNNVGAVNFNKLSTLKKDLRNNFITYGYINDPDKDYHLEFRFDTYKEAIFTYKELKSLCIKSGVSTRERTNEKKFITYIKSGDEIIKFLKVLGANKAHKKYLKKFENKILNQNINRKVNFEAANIKKAATASTSQLNDIKKLLKNYRLKELDPKLQDVIIARKKNPELSLSELASVIGDISKSALNHRFNKIRELAYEAKRK